MKEALLYKAASEGAVDCGLCNRRCHILDGGVGNCGVRLNKGGKLYAMTYAKPCSIMVDPIEKKPFFHFMPGTESLSIATVGCNFHCLNCQNSEISQARWDQGPQDEVPPEKVVALAHEAGTPSISYTYTEPTIFYEYAKDISGRARRAGIKNTFVTNGYMTKEMIRDYKTLDAARVDLKGDDRFYKEVCGGIDRERVLESIRLLNKKVWTEVITLIIPGYNDDDDSIREIAEFVKATDKEIPLHFTAFYPAYKLLDALPTPRETLVRARALALDVGVQYVYCGNTYSGEPYENTFCPECGELVIQRHGFALVRDLLRKNKCPACGHKVPIIRAP